MTTFTSRNVPMVEDTDPAHIGQRVNPVAQLVHDRPGVSALTTTERNALTGAELWDGRCILNTTTDRFNRYDLGTLTWVAIADSSEVAALLATTGAPADLALTASRGVAAFAARSDHVHAAPAWQTYTPVLSGGWAKGGAGAVLTGRYQQIGKTIHFRILLVLGSGFTAANAPFSFTLPANTAPVNGTNYSATTTSIFTDVGAANYTGFGVLTATNAVIYTQIGATTGTPSGTAPFTWVAGDFVEMTGTYEAA